MNITYYLALIEQESAKREQEGKARAAKSALVNLGKSARKVCVKGMLKADRDFIARLARAY